MSAESHTAVCLALTRAITKSRTVEEIYEAALDALASGVGVQRASILLFDADGVMRFKASRGLSAAYRRAVEGHTPWRPDCWDPEPIVVPDVTQEPSLTAYLPVFDAESIAALAFIPLCSLERTMGKFMLYYAEPHTLSQDDLDLAGIVAAQVSFAVERTRTEQQARASEERLRFALDAASMGTWDWNLESGDVRWSDNLERLHGLPEGTFDGTFASYEREIHPEDRPRVLAAVRRAIAEGDRYEVEYRVVAPDGTVRWCEGKGKVEHQAGHAVRMTGVCMMVTRRKEAELARLAAAEDASRLKDEFLAVLSHELRTPLNAILGWLHMLQSGELGPERRRQAIDVIGRNARLQAQLIEDILDVSRIITGKFEMSRSLVALPRLIETVLADAAPLARTKDVVFTIDVSPDMPPVVGDAKRLHQVLNNLLSNAVKFSPRGAVIDVSCALRGGWLEVAVRDHGVGIAPQFLPFVFDRFRQGDSRSTRRHGGLGLGLAIARHLVEQHAGEIAAHSDGIGCGTTMTVRLPPAVSGERWADPAIPEARPAAASDPLDRLDGMTVLLVDDDRDSREMLAALLEQRGARVIAYESAMAASASLDADAAQVIVADIAMPEVDGYAFLRAARAQGVTTPAVAVTAFARSHDREQALAAGYDAYCAKPVDVPALVRIMRSLAAPSQPAV